MLWWWWRNMGVWQGVAMDFLKFPLDPSCPNFLRLTAVSEVARPQGNRPYAYGERGNEKKRTTKTQGKEGMVMMAVKQR
jgi:hypothetical protein